MSAIQNRVGNPGQPLNQLVPKSGYLLRVLGALRLSLSEDNTQADVDAVLRIVPEIVKELRGTDLLLTPLFTGQASGNATI